MLGSAGSLAIRLCFIQAMLEGKASGKLHYTWRIPISVLSVMKSFFRLRIVLEKWESGLVHTLEKCIPSV